MKKGIRQPLVQALLLLAATLTGYSQEETPGGDRLPDREYPVTFAATVEGQTATRATTANAWYSTPYSDKRPTTFSVKPNQSDNNNQQSNIMYAIAEISFRNPAFAFKHLPVKVVVSLKAGNSSYRKDIPD